jgi:hypothetical protein
MIYLIDPQKVDPSICILKFCGKYVPLYGVDPTKE